MAHPFPALLTGIPGLGHKQHHSNAELLVLAVLLWEAGPGAQVVLEGGCSLLGEAAPTHRGHRWPQ